MLRRWIGLLACLLSHLAFAQYVPGVTVGQISGNGVKFVAPTATIQVMVCVPLNSDVCWPSTASSVSSVALDSLAPTDHVWAILPPAISAAWLQVNAITAVSPPAATQTVAPGAPIPLTWQAPTVYSDGTALMGALTYNVYRALGTATATKIASNLSVLAYTDSVSTPGTYTYTVTAIQAGLESNPSPSNGIIASAPPKTPDAPGKPTITLIAPLGGSLTVTVTSP